MSKSVSMPARDRSGSRRVRTASSSPIGTSPVCGLTLRSSLRRESSTWLQRVLQLPRADPAACSDRICLQPFELKLCGRQQLKRVVVQGARETASRLVPAGGDVAQELPARSRRLFETLDRVVELSFSLPVLPHQSCRAAATAQDPGVIVGEPAARVIRRDQGADARATAGRATTPPSRCGPRPARFSPGARPARAIVPPTSSRSSWKTALSATLFRSTLTCSVAGCGSGTWAEAVRLRLDSRVRCWPKRPKATRRALIGWATVSLSSPNHIRQLAPRYAARRRNGSLGRRVLLPEPSRGALRRARLRPRLQLARLSPNLATSSTTAPSAAGRQRNNLHLAPPEKSQEQIKPCGAQFVAVQVR